MLISNFRKTIFSLKCFLFLATLSGYVEASAWSNPSGEYAEGPVVSAIFYMWLGYVFFNNFLPWLEEKRKEKIERKLYMAKLLQDEKTER